MATLLRALREQQHLTRQAMLDRLERRAREMREIEYALSERQFARLEAGEVKTAARQANRRVLEAEFGKPYEDLVAVTHRHQPARVSSGGLALEATTAAHFDAIIGHLARLDHQQGAAHVLGPTTAVYSSVMAIAKSARPGERQSCLRLAARCAELIGWFEQDSGNHGKAREWTIHAQDLAEAVQAAELVPYILMRRSSIAVELGDADAALLLAERALRSSGTGVERSLALREVAAAHALDRDGRRFRDAVEQALDYAADRGPRSSLTVYCTVPYLLSEAGAAALTMGDAKLAINYLESAVREWEEGQPRDQALCSARLALAYAHDHDVERAAMTGLDAVLAVTVAPSARARGALHELRRVLSPHETHPALLHLHHELSSVR